MNELMIDLQNHSKKPLYEQIYEYIRNNTADGKFSCGEKLPSTRLLARHLQVSRSTVELAYEQLMSEGYIESEPYKGYFISDISGLYVNEGKRHLSNLTAETAHPKHHKVPVAAKGRQLAFGQCSVVFSPYKNEMSHFPYSVWRKITKNILTDNDPTLFLSGNAAGELELREAICAYLYQARGVNCTRGQVIIGAGNEYLLILLSQVLGREKRVAMENPTYLQAYRTFCNMGYQVEAVGMDENGLCIEEVVDRNPDIVYTMPSHQFPMGTVMPLKRRLELLRWAGQKQGRYIIEDDHDSEFRYKGKPIPSLQGNDKEGKVVYIGTFSKSVGPSIRVSYMVLPEGLLEAYGENCGFYASTVSKEQQKVLAAFMKEGYFERHLNRMRGVYKGKHDFFLNLLKKERWVHKIYGDNAGTHLLVELNTEMAAENIVMKAAEKGIRIYTLEEYQIPGTEISKRKYETLLLGYGALSEEEMEKGIRAIRFALGDSEDEGKDEYAYNFIGRG